MKSKYENVNDLIVQILNFFMDLSKHTVEYIEGTELYPSEIHAISSMANSKDMNITELSNALNISMGAASKIASKLEQKGCVERYKLLSNKKEIYMRLTEKGLSANQGHDAYHHDMDTKLMEYFESLNNYDQEAILKFLQMYLMEMKQLPRQKK